MTWKIVLTPTARELLAAIGDRRIRGLIRDRIDGLAAEPDKQGRPLTSELAGYRSVRVAGQRYRIIYSVEKETVVVVVVGMGIRKEGDKKDVYALARKLLRLGLLDPES